MMIVDLKIQTLEIPFRVEFQHSSASRSSTETVLVIAKDVNGNVNYGEGCPRSYVTNETVESAISFFSTFHSEFVELNSLEKLKLWIELHSEQIDSNPAAFCAIEMALINTYRSWSRETPEEILKLPDLSGIFNYTAVIGASSPKVFETQLRQYLSMGFSDFKLKLFGDKNTDTNNVDRINELVHKPCSIRLDANNLWPDSAVAIDYLSSLQVDSFAIEEPLKVGSFDDCRKIARSLNQKIILDESFTRIEDFENISADPETWIVNLRISKMGGVLRSLNIIEESKQLEIKMVVGAQVGETSLLTRSALTIANQCRDILIGQEGAFGTFLLERDIIEEPLMFGRGGMIRASDVKLNRLIFI